jgi:hypothetical protein
MSKCLAKIGLRNFAKDIDLKNVINADQPQKFKTGNYTIYWIKTETEKERAVQLRMLQLIVQFL